MSDGIKVESAETMLHSSIANKPPKEEGTELSVPELESEDEKGKEPEPEVEKEEEAKETEGGGDDEEEQRLQRIIQLLAAEEKKKRKEGEKHIPYQPHPALTKEYLKQKYGESLGEEGFDAIVEMINEIAFAHQDYYHRTEVAPHIRSLLQSQDMAQEEAAIHHLQVKFKDIDQHLERMAEIIEGDEDIRKMPPEKRIKYAYLEAISEALPESLKKAEQHGRNNQLREMKHTLRTIVDTGSRSETRKGIQSIPPEAMRVFKAMGVDPVKAWKQSSGRERGE